MTSLLEEELTNLSPEAVTCREQYHRTLCVIHGFNDVLAYSHASQYRAKDTPWYTLGHGIQLAYITKGFIATSVLILGLREENKRRERGERDEVIIAAREKAEKLDAETMKQGQANGIYECVEAAKRAKGDLWSGYRYHL